MNDNNVISLERWRRQKRRDRGIELLRETQPERFGNAWIFRFEDIEEALIKAGE